ncbi:hypothetical protein [Francisella sp. 19X1-34]|uniref:hypothetical protein n=1 Tax=Francisella sp. 19X1-34 TaxID=3087177 RepID=UPI002E368E52|nr:hypothetical protein [Francisella sp. 19X1-34]MED7788503.1 hypothetical protein [Francisella sp. 19X1-34]
MLKKIVIALASLSFFAISNAETHAQKQGIDSLNKYIEQTDKYTRDIELEKLKTQLNSLRLQNKQFQDKLGTSSQFDTSSVMSSPQSYTSANDQGDDRSDSNDSSGEDYKSDSDENTPPGNSTQQTQKVLSTPAKPAKKKKVERKIVYSANAVPSDYSLTRVSGFADKLRAKLNAGKTSLYVSVGQIIFNQYKILEIHQNYVKIENLASSTYKNVYIKSSSNSQGGYEGGYGGYN